MSEKLRCGRFTNKGLEWSPSIARRPQRTAPFSDFRGGRPCLVKNAKNGPFWRVFENLKLAVRQCYQTGQY